MGFICPVAPAKLEVVGKAQKNSACTGICGKSETSLNTVVHENVKVRGWSDKYLASPPDGVTIARRVYCCVEPSCRRLTSKFQSNQICGFVSTLCRSERVHGF